MTAIYGENDLTRFVTEPPKHPGRSEFERDRARVLHSSGLRRLSGKTQVVRVGMSDNLRNRLTHSLEVAQVGRELAKRLGCDPDLVDAACLSHDLGHPPFGHNGERAIAEMANGIGGFEGNAQTFRILTRLEPKNVDEYGNSAGINITRATLDATIKYPWRIGQGPEKSTGEPTKKFGVYDADLPIFEWVRDGKNTQDKCLEAQIMDISDDIAYSVHDVEDAVVKNSLDLNVIADSKVEEQVLGAVRAWYDPVGISDEEIARAFMRLLQMEQWVKDFTFTRADIARLKNITSELIGRFILSICDATGVGGQTGQVARYDANLIIPADTLAEIYVLKGLAVLYVMAPREHEPTYQRERTLLHDLCDVLWDSEGQKIAPQFKIDWNAAADDNERLRVVVDQVASLTDTSANRLHAEICGVFSLV